MDENGNSMPCELHCSLNSYKHVFLSKAFGRSVVMIYCMAKHLGMSVRGTCLILKFLHDSLGENPCGFVKERIG